MLSYQAKARARRVFPIVTTAAPWWFLIPLDVRKAAHGGPCCGAYAAAPCSRAWCTWWAPWRVHWPPVRVRCPVALSWSATFAHEKPARRCSMMAASVSCSPWCQTRRPSMNWNP